MKPLNADSQSCDPISSNCVIWQGPDIECIKLCKGDTISDVVNKLAIELCKIMDTLNVTNYDLSCFNLVICAPEDFQALIQFLIGRVCELEKCTGCTPDCNGNSTLPTTTGSGTGCPDCTVSIATCFQFTNEFGDLVTTMQLSDYVHAIGNQVCQIVDQIVTINSAIADLNARVIVLENTPPPTLILPSFTPKSVLPANPTDIVTILEALEEQFGLLRSATGTPDEIFQAIVKQCNALSTALALGPNGGSMGSIDGWINSPSNMADTITNMWLTVCDLRSAVTNIKLNCCPDGCEDITIDLQLTFIGTVLRMFFTGNIPAGFQHCNPSGVLFTITDTSGGLVNVFADVLTNMNNINGVQFNLNATPLNLLNNLTVTGTPCFHNNVTNATCQSSLSETFYNVAVCPILFLIPATNSMDFSATTFTGTATYTIEVWNAAGDTLLQSSTQTLVGPGTFSGTLLGLSSGTLYKIRLVITLGTVVTECAFQSVTTLGAPCLAPTSAIASISIGGIPVVPTINLNSACGFAVLAGSTITTVGTTNVNGDLGLDPGVAVTGPVVVSGATEINTPAAISAKVDLTSAYNAAAAAIPTADLSGIDLGTLTLTPGVYFFSSSAAITGALTLNGAGNYIFQIGTTLITDGGADVVLTNGALAENVFWQVGTSATLGASTVFNGIIMADQSITVNEGTVNGALMARIGAVTFVGAGVTTVNYVGCP